MLRAKQTKKDKDRARYFLKESPEQEAKRTNQAESRVLKAALVLGKSLSYPAGLTSIGARVGRNLTELIKASEDYYDA